MSLYDSPILNTTWRTITWTEFCQWLNGKRVVHEDTPKHYGCNEFTILHFHDGTQARLTSVKTEGTPYYSEYTPGSDGDLIPPTVEIFDE